MSNAAIIRKWSILVVLNSIVSFSLAILTTEYLGFLNVLGMTLGIVTFIAIYSKIDIILIRNNKHELSRTLFWAAIVKMCTQVYPVIEVALGFFAAAAVELAVGKVVFFSTYLTTLTEGVLLSIVVCVLMLPVKLILTLKWIPSVGQ